MQHMNDKIYILFVLKVVENGAQKLCKWTKVRKKKKKLKKVLDKRGGT